MSLEEFQAADFGVGDRPVELIDGFVVIAQAFPSFQHGRIANNLGRALSEAIERAGHEDCVAETGTGIDVRLDHDFSIGPDVLVRCEGGFEEAGVPVLVVEILSPSNSAADMLQKLRAYKSVPSITDILIFDQDRFYGQHHVREAEIWQKPIDLVGSEAVVRIARLNADVPLAAVYANVLRGAEA